MTSIFPVADDMAEYRHLGNAPITEALIDLRVRLPAEFQVEKFSSLRETLHDQYPNVDTRKLIEGEMEIGGDKLRQSLRDTGIHGYVFKSLDNTKVAQFRKDGFTFSRLKPYTCWEDISAEAKNLWKLYVAKASPELVTRIAVRYINQLNIPLPIDDLARYLTVPPRVPANVPQEISTFFSRVVVHDLEQDIAANIIQVLQGSSMPNHVAIILDIDVYKQKESGFEESDIWLTFERLRDLKNRIFFDSITEGTVSLYK